jgi:AcrR family transcriptional regulator
MHTHLVGTGSSPGASSAEKSWPPDDSRERLIAAALELCTHQGYYATTIDQVAAKASVSLADVAGYFATTEDVLMSIVNELSEATAVALKDVESDLDPERALLRATTAALTAVVEGRAAVSWDRLVAMARIVISTRNLQRRVSATRKRVLTQPLADWMGVDPRNRRLQHALTMWSAVTASAYVAVLGVPNGYESESDVHLRRRMITNLSESFGDVMGEDPQRS